jgi:hypothetical protein
LWFIIVLVSLAVLTTLFLCIPLDLIFRGNTEGRPKCSIRLIWLFGLVSTELRRTRRKPPEEREVEHKKKPGDLTQRLRLSLDILQTKGLPTQLLSFIKRTIRQIKVRELVANLKVDLENPADTGLLFAFIAPANLLVNYFLPYPIKIQPSFTGESFIMGRLYGDIRLWPIQFAACLMGLAFSLPTMRVVKKLVIYKWKRKR